MKVMAIDLGTVRTGIALSDKSGTLASPYCVLKDMGRKRLTEAVFEICAKEAVEKILVGCPVRTDGKKSEMQEKAESFALFLSKRTTIPVELCNEAYSTVIAAQKLHEINIKAREQQKNIDAAAAAVVLQSYLDNMDK